MEKDKKEEEEGLLDTFVFANYPIWAPIGSIPAEVFLFFIFFFISCMSLALFVFLLGLKKVALGIAFLAVLGNVFFYILVSSDFKKNPRKGVAIENFIRFLYPKRLYKKLP